jgi:hypothetical protein
MGRTGQTNQVSGIYRADHCSRPERAIPKRATFFPRVPNTTVPLAGNWSAKPTPTLGSNIRP